MKKFQVWFNESPFASYLRALVAVVISNAVVEFVRVGHFDFTNWQTWGIGALAATLPTLLRLLNPADKLNL